MAPPGTAPTPSPSYPNPSASAAPAPVHTSAPEDVQMAMAINASIQSALAEGVPISKPQPVNLTANTNGWGASPDNTTFSGWGQSSGAPPATKLVPAPDPYNGWAGVRPSSSSPQLHTGRLETPTVLPSAHEAPPTISVPSAPPIEETFYSGPIQYPTIDSSPVDLSVPPPAAGKKPEPFDSKDGGSRSSTSSSSCVVCLDAPVEGACIPCGHMAGCMSCLGEIKGKKWGCPVCRAEIDRVIRLYAV